jgi:hypothetical protein
MDAQGIDVQIRSLAPPGTQPIDPADALPLAMRANDIAADERTAGLGFVGAMVYARRCSATRWK